MPELAGPPPGHSKIWLRHGRDRDRRVAVNGATTAPNREVSERTAKHPKRRRNPVKKDRFPEPLPVPRHLPYIAGASNVPGLFRHIAERKWEIFCSPPRTLPGRVRM